MGRTGLLTRLRLLPVLIGIFPDCATIWGDMHPLPPGSIVRCFLDDGISTLNLTMALIMIVSHCGTLSLQMCNSLLVFQTIGQGSVLQSWFQICSISAKDSP